jgi:hypothetical protein
VLTEYKQPVYYEQPVLHVSVASVSVSTATAVTDSPYTTESVYILQQLCYHRSRIMLHMCQKDVNLVICSVILKLLDTVLTTTAVHHGVAQVAGDLTELLPELAADYTSTAAISAATDTATATTTAAHTAAAAAANGHTTTAAADATTATTGTAAGDSSSDEDEDVLCIQVHTVTVKAGFKLFEIPLG